MRLNLRLGRFYCSLISIILLIPSVAVAGNPGGAHYSEDNSNIFWFALISDTHIGIPLFNEEENLDHFLEDIDIIKSNSYSPGENPKYIIALGDLTDHYWCDPTGEGGLSCDHQGQWDEYKEIVVQNHGMNSEFYYDAPGNHDQYFDQFLSLS